MKPEFNSRRLFGITRAKGKMYELGLPNEMHLAVPDKSEPQELFLLTVGTLGDAAALLSEAEDISEPLTSTIVEELSFSASFFDAFIESRFNELITHDTTLLAAATYYLARRPGSSLVLARRLEEQQDPPAVDNLLRWVLQSRWNEYPDDDHPLFGNKLGNVAKSLAYHFYDGSNLEQLSESLPELKSEAYSAASSRELLFIDIITAVVRMRLAASAWTTLPRFTGIPSDQWKKAIQRPEFPKELWPSQMLLGQAGLFSGASGIVQMPTSAGKTRSVEIVLRSAFLSGRTRLAVVVAPFRALCHEIGTSIRYAFRNDDVNVNELSDAMQLDFLEQISAMFGSELPTSQCILVMTPEKLLYVLRQRPSLINDIGLVVYDEGHQFDSGTRGITYELLLTQIKALLPSDAQTVLVSAVIQNARAIGEWLIGDDVKVVSGDNLLPTARSVAFASWIERLGQLMFYESNSYEEPDYFVPRVIESQALARRRGQRDDQYFPVKNDSSDIAIYLGIRLVEHGAVAIFCGRKDTASKMAARAVEVYERGFGIKAPATFGNEDELFRMKNLIDRHFGNKSITSRAASLGIFVHHGTTPHGIRLSIEYAMQQKRINFVACTSTLAQGVNLPIRYLIVSGTYQGAERIKVRDFQNLIGRAGRSGIHTEGLVIFSDPAAFDRRKNRRESWRFSSSVELLSPSFSENTTSSLLGLLDPICSSNGNDSIHLNANDLCDLIFFKEDAWLDWAKNVVTSHPMSNFSVKELIGDLRKRRRLFAAIESYLMANREVGASTDFRSSAETLAESTLAYNLATEEVKSEVKNLFSKIAEYLEANEPNAEKQRAYSKTLLGIKNSKEIEQWVNENRTFLLTLDTNEDWLLMVWSLFERLSDSKFFHTVAPEPLLIQLAMRWIQGLPYSDLFVYSNSQNGTKAWGEKQRRRLTDDDIVVFCESVLGFECSLILAAVSQFLFGDRDINDESAAALTLFQKSLKYGLSDWLFISCYEYGFSDRVLAQHLCSVLRAEGFEGKFFATAVDAYRKQINLVLTEYPSYFESLLLVDR